MNKLIKINKEEFKVKSNEFNTSPHDEFNNLNILESLGFFERITSLLKELRLVFTYEPNILFYNITHGGFIPINCSNVFKNIFIYNSEDKHNDNILANIYKHNVQNISIVDKSILTQDNIHVHDIVFINEEDISTKLDINKSIVLKFGYLNDEKGWYSLKNTKLLIHIPEKLADNFTKEFQYFIEDNNVLNYDNLIHYTMIVKNGGDSLEDILTKNLSVIDRWTIVDTGSTDNTVDIIKKVLVGKKKGNLYYEDFVNFKDNRNNCLDLAGKDCKFLMMLDDTYIIEGPLREFLNTVRGDQFSDSFSLFIKSNDVNYASNRIVKSESNLRYIYRIHEVITPKNNMNVIIPFKHATIFDYRSDFMQNRTMNRKLFDIELLTKELEDDPDDPRALYYLGQTYNLLENYELAFEYYLKRVDHPIEGFKQERIDACFEAARTANFKLNKSWDYCEKLYNRCFEIDTTRSDPLYFIAIHYYLEMKNNDSQFSKNLNLSYTNMKKCFELGYPEHCQYSLKPTLHFYFLLKFLAELSYMVGDYETGLKCTNVFLENVKEDNSVLVFKECFSQIDYTTIKSWNSIFSVLSLIPKRDSIINVKNSQIPLLIFMTDGGFSAWTGRDILNKGMGGAETFVIEIARHLQKSGYFKVIVFCRCEENEIFEGVEYRRLQEYFSFLFENTIHTCIIGRYSEYYPITLRGNVKNIYMIAHDLDFTGNVIPIDNRLKNIFCLSNWHTSYFSSMYKSLQDIIKPFGYGIDSTLFDSNTKNITDNFPIFIYSSYPIRGLLPLLQMWPKIIQKYPNALLHIHSDINGKWSNDMRPIEMNLIKELLISYADDKSIIYHGWTDKNKLAKSWVNSDICFYPCTYNETFCHTMLEAAISKTLIVTNALAALNDTVGDRGILVNGNFYNEEFQNQALIELFKIIEDKDKWNYLVEKNYKWVKEFTWENRTNTLLNDYLLPTLDNQVRYIEEKIIHKNVNPLLNYADMYNWTNDIPANSNNIFLSILDYIKWKNTNKDIKILEIGTYTGTSVIKFLEVLQNSKAWVIDMWEDYNEYSNNIQVDILRNIKQNNIEKIFQDNIQSVNMTDRITVLKGDSANILIDMLSSYKNYFDFIYVDGSHTLIDCYMDTVLSFNLLKKGGVLAIDDYFYNRNVILESPYEGVNHFLRKYDKYIKILSKDYRVFLEKL